MNQDSDKNDPKQRRTDEPRQREGRSFDRRDDGRNNETPRFNRSRDTDSAGSRNRNEERKPWSNDRPGRPDRPTPAPRFSRDGDARPNRRSDDDRPRFERKPDDRPTYNRDSRPRDDKPRFDKDRRDSRPDESRPHFTRTDQSGASDQRRPRFSDERSNRTTRSDDRPRFGADRSNDRQDKPRFGRSQDDRPKRENDRSGDDSRRNRDDRPERPSRFSGDRNRSGNAPKPAFKRVGGFNREADERNRFRAEDERQPSSGRRNDRDNDVDQPSRFSGQQRKDSGERRTGFFVKAPNYDLARPPRTGDSFKQGGKPGARKTGSRKDSGRDANEGDNEKGSRASANDGTTRLNRYIANSGVCSRREADELIAQGDISVNGNVVTEMGYKVKEGDTVKYGTKTLNPERFVYVLVNKPKNYITTNDDPEERKTVLELVADAGNFRLYPVGRLDRNTTGLLLMTNDGELADKLTHPSNNIRKIYQVELDKPITDEHFEALKKGIELEDGPIKPDALSIVTPDAYVIGVEIHSGRNRIVRRMFEHFGYEVSKLDRTTYAGLTKKDLPRGKWRFLDPKEVVKLKYFN